MFLRERRAPRADSTTRPTANVPPERQIVLTGVLHQDAQYTAIFEDTRNGAITVVRENGVVLRGRVRNITLNSADYVTDGATVTVAVGNNLENGRMASSEPAASSGGSTQVLSEVEQRMRQRRLQELGR
jgi:hypothetical protein